MGKHVLQQGSDTQHNVYDKIRRDWVSRFATVQTERSKPASQTSSDTEAHNKESEPQATMGWALAKSSGPTQFSAKVKEYLTKTIRLRGKNRTESRSRTGGKGHA